jgi:hypothetical protein
MLEADVYEALRAKPLRRDGLVKVTGLSTMQVRTALQRLRHRGLIKKIGVSRGALWYQTDPLKECIDGRLEGGRKTWFPVGHLTQPGRHKKSDAPRECPKIPSLADLLAA